MDAIDPRRALRLPESTLGPKGVVEKKEAVIWGYSINLLYYYYTVYNLYIMNII